MSGKTESWYEWLPDSWDAKKLKYVVNLRNEKFVGEGIESYIGLENIESKTGRYLPSTNPELNIEGTSNRFYAGDILFGKLRPYLAKCIEAEFDGVGTTELLVLNVNDKFILTKYLKSMMLSPKFIDYINSSTYGTKMPRANWDFIGDIEIPLPSITQQKAIVDYVTSKVIRIDTLISKKEKLITLLEQQRQSIITEAVTKGLNPSVKMKDSGVEWIGEIPEHWEEQRIKYIFYESNERNFNEDATLLSLFTSIGVKPRSEMEEKGNKAQTVINYKVVRKGDIVVNKLLAWMGAIGLSEYNGVTSPDYDVYSPLKSARIDELYYHYYFRNHYFKGDCFKFGRGIMMMRWRTYPEQLKSILVPVPPKEEQIQIANYIEKKEKELALTIKNIEHSIQKLKEYRQALIYEAVTGKIDVRDMELD